MKHTDDLTIIIPAYNEEATIREVIEGWYRVVERHDGHGNSRLVVINDGSRDGTGRILEEFAKDHPLFEAVTHENQGFGRTVIGGYRYAIARGTEFVFQTDSDGQTSPDEFEKFWRRRREFDGIFGWRKNRQDGWKRKMIERVLCLFLRVILGIRVPDSNAPYRLMRTQVLAKYIDRIPEGFNVVNVLVTAYFALYGEKIRFVKISFCPRVAGTTVASKAAVKQGVRVTKELLRIRRKYGRKGKLKDG